MVTWSDIKRWDPAELETAYDAFEQSEVAVQSAGDSLWDAANSFGNAGVHAESARTNLGRRRAEADKLEALLSDLMSCTRVAATNVSNVKKGVLEAEGYASRERLTIDGSGGVSINPEVRAEAEQDALIMNAQFKTTVFTYDMMDVWKRAVAAKAELERFIQEVVDNATTADNDYAGALNTIQEGKATAESTAASAGSSTGDINSQALLDLLNKEGSVPDKRAAWDALSEEQQQALIDKHYVDIGAMNGVPFEDRVKANDKNIDREIGELDNQIADLRQQLRTGEFDDNKWTFWKNEGEDERKKIEERIAELEGRRNYFDSLKSGDGNGAVLFDPDNNRVVEMIGDPSQQGIAEVVTMVSGTNTTIDSVGNYSELPKYLVEQGTQQGKPAVAFNFYDGRFQGEDEWISWSGDHSNRNEPHLQQLGANLAEFQEALAVEDMSRGADNNVIGHSAGHSVVTASEVASQYREGVPNATYDNLHSLSGSYAPSGWSAQGGTEYDHYAYNGEPISVVGLAKENTPHSHEAYEQHWSDFDEIPKEHREWYDRFNPLDIHTRSSDGGSKNLPLLQDLTHEIYKD